MTPRHCWSHRPRPHWVLPCLEPRRWSRIRPIKKDVWRHKWMSKRDVRHLLVLRMEQLKVGINDLSSVVKKKVTAVSGSYTEAFPMAGLALQLEVPTVAAASIPDRKVGRSARTLAWMTDWMWCRLVSSWRRWRPVSSWRRWWEPRRRLPNYGRPFPRHHRCWTHMRTL
jgi:hypothetical protein